MTTLQISVDEAVKQDADGLFASLGLDTSTAVRIFLNAAIEYGGFPFLIAHTRPESKTSAEMWEEIPNAETTAALEEGEEMIRNPEKYKRYTSFREAMEEVLKDA